MRLRLRLFVSVLLVVPMVAAAAVPAVAHNVDTERAASAAAPSETGAGVAMKPVANVQYPPLGAVTAQNGSDIEFMKLGDKEYALAGTLRNGLQVVDITDPTKPVLTKPYDCPLYQGDVQVFRQGERILAAYVADSAINSAEKALESACVTEANARGAKIDGTELGTFLIDVTDPAKPTTLSFMEIPEGSHNQTVHPSGDYLYNSNSDLVTKASIPQITIHDISDPEKPRHVQDFTWTPRPGLGSESHDLFFNTNGTRAYSAAVSSTLILDTSNPEAPSIISQIYDPEIEVVHQSDLVSLPREDGTVRDLLIITDEQGGAAATAGCPGGGLHVYDVTGDLESNPAKQGRWFIPTVQPQNPLDVCTSHVLRMYPDQKMMTIAWYTQGVRVLDISGLAEFEGSPTEVAFGDGVGMKEIGNYVFEDANTWAFKTNRIEADGSMYAYGNDMARGFDVYRFDGELDVPVFEPEDLTAEGCTGVPRATAYVDRATARDVHERGIDCAVSRAMARGIPRAAKWFYEPLTDVNRGQMASFIVNMMRAAGIDAEWPKAPAEDKFGDVAESAHRANINLLAEAGIVSGVGGGKYEPEQRITRGQMATFMVSAANFARATDLTGDGVDRFSDVGGIHGDSIEVGADNGLFSGVSASQFAPKGSVARDQMASFLVNTLVALGGPNGPGRPVVNGY